MSLIFWPRLDFILITRKMKRKNSVFYSVGWIFLADASFIRPLVKTAYNFSQWDRHDEGEHGRTPRRPFFSLTHEMTLFPRWTNATPFLAMKNATVNCLFTRHHAKKLWPIGSRIENSGKLPPTIGSRPVFTF